MTRAAAETSIDCPVCARRVEYATPSTRSANYPRVSCECGHVFNPAWERTLARGRAYQRALVRGAPS